MEAHTDTDISKGGSGYEITAVYNRKGILEEIYWNCVKADYA